MAAIEPFINDFVTGVTTKPYNPNQVPMIRPPVGTPALANPVGGALEAVPTKAASKFAIQGGARKALPRLATMAKRTVGPLGVATAALTPLAKATAKQAQESGQPMPTQIATQTKPTTNWDAPTSTGAISFSNPFTGAPVKKTTNTSTVNSFTPPVAPLVEPQMTSIPNYGMPDYKLDQDTSRYGANYGGVDYPMGSEGSKGAMVKAGAKPLTLYGSETPLTEEQRAANAALDMKRITDSLALHRASNERDALEGEQRQAALDKGLAQAKATAPWYAGGTAESRLAGSAQLDNLMQTEKENSAIKMAQAQHAPIDTPELLAAKIAKFGAETEHSKSQADSERAKIKALPVHYQIEMLKALNVAPKEDIATQEQIKMWGEAAKQASLTGDYTAANTIAADLFESSKGAIKLSKLTSREE